MTAANIRRHFGKDILSDKLWFLSAFDDFAPKLRREKKILEFALDEQINWILLDADKKGADKKEIAVKNSRGKLIGEAWLSERAAHMAIECFTAVLGWNTAVNTAANALSVVRKNNINNIKVPEKLIDRQNISIRKHWTTSTAVRKMGSGEYNINRTRPVWKRSL